MTASGGPPSETGGLGEPDWIDQILERATGQVDTSQPSGSFNGGAGSSAEAEPETAEPETDEAGHPEKRTTAVDSLADIRWVDSPQVTPASTPIVPGPGSSGAMPAPGAAAGAPGTVQDTKTSLVPEAVGRSAWDDELIAVGTDEPEGWDQLSWQDLDDRSSGPKEPLREQTSFGRLLREWGPVLFMAIAIALFVRLVLVQAYHIPSSSMVPTLENGDRVVVNRLSYQFGEIERGQVVVFAKPEGTAGENDLIKRVIGLPGETVRLVDDQVYINDLRLEEPYLAEPTSTVPRQSIIPGCAQAEPSNELCVVPEDHVFVMGDNRRGSSDGRVFGPIEVDAIVGRAFLRVWPMNNVGQL